MITWTQTTTRIFGTSSFTHTEGATKSVAAIQFGEYPTTSSGGTTISVYTNGETRETREASGYGSWSLAGNPIERGETIDGAGTTKITTNTNGQGTTEVEGGRSSSISEEDVGGVNINFTSFVTVADTTDVTAPTTTFTLSVPTTVVNTPQRFITTESYTTGSFVTTARTTSRRIIGTLTETGAFPTTAQSFATTTWTRAKAATAQRTQTASVSSTWTQAQYPASLSRATHYILEPNEEIWVFTTSSTKEALLSEVASKASSSGVLTALTSSAQAGKQANTQELNYVTVTSVKSFGGNFGFVPKTITITTSSFRSVGHLWGLPAATGTITAQTADFIATGTESETVYDGQADFTISAVSVATSTFSYTSSNTTWPAYFSYFSTKSAELPIITTGSSSYSDGNATKTTTFSSSGGGEKQIIETYGFVSWKNDVVLQEESSFAGGWAALNEPTDAAFVVEAQGITFPVSNNAVVNYGPDFGAWLGAPFLAVPRPTSLTMQNASGSITYTVGGGGVSVTSIGTASNAVGSTTSGSWATNGTPNTQQNPSVANTNVSGNLLHRFGGIPARGGPLAKDNIKAVIAPGAYWSAADGATGTTAISTTQTLEGTKQTAVLGLSHFAQSTPQQFQTASHFVVIPPALYNSADFFPTL